MITELEAHRRQAAATLDKLNAPQRAAALAEAQIADLDEQISQAKRAEQEAREREIRKALAIADARVRLDNRYDLRLPCYELYKARLRLVELGESDPGDILISVEQIARVLYEARQQEADALRADLVRSWGETKE